jgi:hypothetical protein
MGLSPSPEQMRRENFVCSVDFIRKEVIYMGGPGSGRNKSPVKRVRRTFAMRQTTLSRLEVARALLAVNIGDLVSDAVDMHLDNAIAKAKDKKIQALYDKIKTLEDLEV